MKNKQQKRLLSLSIATFALIILFAVIIYIPPFFPKSSSKPYSLLNISQIKSIVLDQSGKKIQFIPDNGTWKVVQNNTTYDSNQEKVSSIIKALTDVTKNNPVSTNKNNHSQFGINSQYIEFETNNQKNRIYIGDSQGIGNNYVRFNDENNIYVGQGFSEVFSSTEFRNLKLNLVKDEKLVNNVKITAPESTIMLEKKDSTISFISTLQTLEGTDILRSAPSDNPLGNPILQISFVEGVNTKTLDIYTKDESSYYAKTNTGPNIYVLNTSTVDTLKKPLTDTIK
ncbi:MAG: DUF4340 domain-containing protein [Candidatus Roizmanbacteria bacterium]